MRKDLLKAGCFAITLLAAGAHGQSMPHGQRASFLDVVKLHTGMVSGTGTNVHSYKGLPFAAPPVGALRWRAPEPPKSWRGIRPGTDFAADCMQNPDQRLRAASMSEDCLYANVWTPAKRASDKLPVLFFIYGGSFDHGSGSRFDYDGEKLAAKGMVVVNFNYRTGVFGFFAHKDLTAESRHTSSGNYGLLDQVAALRWVRKNVGQFGGDPSRITIMGQSAGASSVHLLLMSPLTKGLFHNAVSESPGQLMGIVPLAAAEKAWEPLGTDLDALRRASAQELLAKFEVARNPTSRRGGVRIGGPIIDGWAVPRAEREAYRAGQVARVPLIIGNVTNEAGLSIARIPARTVEAYREYMQQRFGLFADRIMAAYPVVRDSDVPMTVIAVSTDNVHGFEARSTAAAMARINPNVFRYYFSRFRNDGPNPPAHADDVSYFFGHLDSATMQGDPAGGAGSLIVKPFNKADEQLSETMMDMLVRFATVSNPNGPTLPAWSPYAKGEYLILDSAITAVKDTHTDQLDAIREYFDHKQ